jgi:hypothetical protein
MYYLKASYSIQRQKRKEKKKETKVNRVSWFTGTVALTKELKEGKFCDDGFAVNLESSCVRTERHWLWSDYLKDIG